MEDIGELKKRIDIVDFAERLGLFVIPQKKKARCFNTSMHKRGDKNPSLSFKVNPNGEGYFKCFACGVSGSIVDLLAGAKGIGISEAIKEIKRDYGTGEGIKPIEYKKADDIKQDLTVIADKKTKEIFKALLELAKNEGISKQVKDYLTGDSRGLTEETIERFGLFCMSNTDFITKELQKYYDTKDLVKAGLFADYGNGLYFNFKDYPVGIPYIQGGEVVYIKARALNGNKNPKYMQVKGLSLPLFNRDVLVNKGEVVYICEGEFDTIIATQNGYLAVGVVGVNGLKDSFIDDLLGFEVVLALDNDDIGNTAIKTLATKLVNRGVRVLGQIDLPKGINDLTDFFNYE